MPAQALEIQNSDLSLMTNVALVEDSTMLRQYLTEMIGETPGYRCVCACASAEEALVEIPKNQPHVVLMDIHLPGESGIVCTARLREKLPELQIIMLTVYKDIKTIFEALKAGACGYVLKRAAEKEILASIAEVRAGGVPMTSEIARMVVRLFTNDDRVGSAMSAMEPPSMRFEENARLSQREMEMLVLLAQGMSNKEIGNQLHISLGTVRTHLTHIYEKLHVRCRTEAAAKFLRSNPLANSKA